MSVTLEPPQWQSMPKPDIAVAEDIANDTHTSVETIQRI